MLWARRKNHQSARTDLCSDLAINCKCKAREQLKFELYQREGVPYYVLVYSEQKTARVYGLVDGKYRKIGDLINKATHVSLNDCQFNFDFGKIWGS